MTLPANIERWILDKNTLQECAGLSLTDRVELLEAKFNFKIGRSTLERAYKRRGIRFGKAQLTYSQGLKPDIDQQRKDFALVLANHIA